MTKPTKEQIEAGVKELEDWMARPICETVKGDFAKATVISIYRAMQAAAPSCPPKSDICQPTASNVAQTRRDVREINEAGIAKLRASGKAVSQPVDRGVPRSRAERG